MYAKQLVLIVVAWLFVFPCFGFNVSALPLIGGQATSFRLNIIGEPSLLPLLDEELRAQRSNNPQLKRLNTRLSIARFERGLLIEWLESEGYYDATVTFQLREEKGINYRVVSGNLYKVQEVYLNLPESIEVPNEVLGMAVGDPLRATSVLAAKNAITDYVKKHDCLWQVNVDYDVVIEENTHAAYVTFTLEESPLVQFGEITFAGLRSIDEDYLLDRIKLRRGDCFKRSRIDKARLTLVQTNLIGGVSAHLGPPLNGEVPVTLNVLERYHRTVSVGGGFQTDQGVGLSLGWEHRNLVKRGQRLRLESRVAETLQTFTSSLTIPHFRRHNQTITLYSDLVREETDAFESNSVDVGVEISRQFKRHWRAKVGTQLSYSSVDDDEEVDYFTLLSFPMSLEYDRRKDPLDPRDGWVASVGIHPYDRIDGAGIQFVQSTLAASAYVSLDQWVWKPTLAVRGAVGTIEGADRDDIPANIRFYVGGGGSVRGYPFQSLGPLEGTTPLGGLSFSEFSFETRFRWGESWGTVVFADGGYAYEERVPQVSEDLLWGAGLGLQYYTSFAPIRFDIAVPLDQREGIDDDFQLYISIGQSF